MSESSVIETSGFDVESIRQQFPILNKPLPNGKSVVYLDTGASAQKPQSVIDKEREVYESYFANAYRGVYYFGAQVDEQLEAAREQIRQFIGARSSSEIIFTSGTTMSINLVANAWGRKFLHPGDEIVINEMEHHANFVPWQQIAAERQATLKFIPLTDDYRLDLSSLVDVITERTKMVALTGMSNVTGAINPVAEVVAKAKQHGAVVLVDGAQSVPHAPTDVNNPEIDFLSFSGHKLYGPTGIGVLYGREELLESMDPFLCGGHMISRVYKDRSEWAASPAKFEAGTIPIAQAIALGAAVDFVAALGFDAIHQHEEKILRYATSELLKVPAMQIYGPSVDDKGAIISFTMEDAHAEDLANLLDIKGVFVRHGHHCTMPLHDLMGVSASVRVSLAVYNNEADIDRLVESLHFARKKLRLA
ncbi:MAG: cysteine desulfurase [Planctomycetaceae bacterium]|nr:cysteine desulfurase [Planctomycetaceae bacterium]